MKPAAIGAAVLVIFITATRPTENERCTQKLDTFAAQRRESAANLFRARSECQAVAIEFNGNSQLVANCLDTYRILAQMEPQTLAAIDRRMQEPDMVACLEK